MATQWQGQITGITRVGAGYTGGVVGNLTNTFSNSLFGPKANAAMWDGAVFGASVTTYNGATFHVYVVGDVGGVQIPIAGLIIASTTSTTIPLVNERTIGVVSGSTTYTAGIPTPTAVVFGNSGIVGKSYSAIVYGMLYRNA